MKLFKMNLKNKMNSIFGSKYIEDFSIYSDKKKIIHISTPTHGNMGDHAIIYATNKYLKDNFRDYDIIEIYRKDIYKYTKALKRILNKDDIIVLIGGGNMGNLWIEEEIDRRYVINTFKDNKIISMPQTISFTNDTNGKKEFEKTKEIYNSHENLIVIAREKKSYEIMKKAFVKCTVILNPDMVLYLNNKLQISDIERKYIMTCIRNDKESLLVGKKNAVIDKLKKEYDNIIVYDTVINRQVLQENREEELLNMFKKFSESKIVITDRLHGMVFAAITKTPCIVTKSLDHKVTGTYEWIKELNYIKLVDELNYENISSLIYELSNLKSYTEIDLDKNYYSKLKEKLI